jgi:hypothetical protein
MPVARCLTHSSHRVMTVRIGRGLSFASRSASARDPRKSPGETAVTDDAGGMIRTH